MRSGSRIQPEIATWYQGTRHTFASQWVIDNGSIEKLAKILGHASVNTTERYAHLRPDLFSESDYAKVNVSLDRPAGDVVNPSFPMKNGTDSGANSYK